jgi:hypothetical protein
MYINKTNLKKYLIQLLVVFLASYTITECNISIFNSVKVGLVSSTLFILIDMLYPNVIKY